MWRNRRDDLEQNAKALVTAAGRSAETEPQDAVPGRETVERHAAAAGRRVRPGMGRIRVGAQVPVDVPPRARAARVHDDRLATTPAGSSPRRSTRWPRAASTTTSAAASPATRSTASGWCRTSRRCSTTRRCWSASTARRTPCSAPTTTARSSRRRSEYVLRDLRHPDGGFYSAEDADSPDEHGHGHEGLFHTWTPAEVGAALDGWSGEDVGAVLEWFGITPERQLRGALDPQPARAPRRARPARPDRARPAPAVRGRANVAHAPASTTRSSPSGTRSSCGRWPTPRPRSSATTGSRPRSPMASSCCASCATNAAAGTARGRPTDHRRHGTRRSPPTTPRSVLAFQRLGELTGEARWVDAALADGGHDARLVLGPACRAGCTPPPRTPRGWSSVRRICSTTPRPRRTRWPPTG